ncbi:LysM peptidoglycan-binding domain-containing protein [Spirosoma validum]|uniref:LysM peptidoglycan-binding domain-containing protein n=1 Tax=Spirosoma validum TaxID=2771355 RepID=A0A927B5X4_9BACT|nr:LysM peptidoglycan-binding domain-containing protein [Spirosoma validum]MBD2755984.1 LysM peptidoglycan-binding domain-containing protein [Spirosoma validum]
MKKQTYSLLLLFLLTHFATLAQTSTPVVPEKVTFADITVALDPDARRTVQQDVNALMSNQQYWSAKLDRVVLYFPIIESILISEGVPTDFKYLAVQESSLTPDAVSTSNAVGYWQFKKETATLNGIRVDDEIDERKSITASTRAAAGYLKKSNAQFNNWVASLYSYYLGATGITKLIPPDWAYAREVALDGRTDRYILRFFAHKIAIENALKFHQTSNRFALIEYPKGGGKTIRTIADELGVDEFELRKYNRWILGDVVPTDKSYVMAIPVASNQINDVREKIGTVPTGTGNSPELAQSDVGFPVLRRVSTTVKSKNDPVLYEINGLPGIQAQAGDNAASLSRKAKISLSSFLRYNDLDESDPVIVNDIYYLAKKRKKALVPFHTVRDGETSRSISQRYGLRLRKLLRFNRVDRGQQLTAGRVMWLRERRPANRPIEIITAPTPPVYDQTPAPPTPARQEVAGNTPTGRSTSATNRQVSGSEGVPRNASERKLYQPKLAGGGITPNDGSAVPATPPATQPTTTNSVSPSRPAPTTSTSSEGSQRVVIVRSQDSDGTTKTVPVATTPEVADRSKPASVEDGWSSNGTKSVKDSEAYTRPRPAKTPVTSRSSADNYTGPTEQQADGTITSASAKSPPRPAAPAVTKADTRPAEAPTVTTFEKVEKKVTTPTVTMVEKKTVTSTATPTAAPTPSVSADRTATTHIVEKGETYYGIARKYGLKLNELLELNNRTLDNKLEAGQKIKVMTGEKTESAPAVGQAATVKTTTKVEQTITKVESAPAKKASESVSVSQSGATYHTVAKGENLFRISKLYNVSVPELQEWNNLSTAYVREGQKIRVAKP